ncbi:MAG: tyrosine-protein phosphatase [Spongiibacteraceae bacterium]
MLSWDLDSSVADAISKSGWDKPESALHAREMLLMSYQSMPYWLIPQLQEIFKCLVRGEAPLLFHCAAGKDRTGISAAIILHVLGIPMETILEDYELTNHAVNYSDFMERNRNSHFGVSSGKTPLTMLDDDIRKVMFSADPDYLMSAINKIEYENGSIDGFVSNVINVNHSDQKKMRDHLLTD